MAERDRPQPHQVQVHTQSRYDQGGGMKSVLPKKGPSTSQVLAVVTLLPVGGTLLALAGLTLVESLIGLAVTTPLFIIFSPVLVPATILVGLAVTAFLTSGAFGLTGLSSLSWVVNFLRQVSGSMLDLAKSRMGDAAIQVGQKTKETGQTIQQKAPEGKESTGGRT
uniref:Oleosin n=1 Tax=Olea europaea subsp. europaea TaxID=158383 RepID=Q8LGL8_OLEEU|nr:oleosin [Olea europaea subsp. europaea]